MRTTSLPSVLGVGLYTLGYGVFATYYAPGIAVQPTTLSALFHAGSWAFVLGSAVLIYACEFAASIHHEHAESTSPAHSALWILCMDRRRTREEVDQLTADHKHKMRAFHQASDAATQPSKVSWNFGLLARPLSQRVSTLNFNNY